MSVNIERALLGSFLFSNDLGMDTKEAFELDVDVFTNEDRRTLASKINEVTQTEDRFYSLLNLQIEQQMTQEWLEIVYYTPFIFKRANMYHKVLTESYRDQIAKEFR